MARKFKTPITIDELGSASSQALAANVDGDSQNRINIDAGGKITWGSGSATGDTTLYRSAADTLKTDDAFTATSLAVTGHFTLPTSDGSADQVITTNGSGTLTWSDVSANATVSDTAPSSPATGQIWYESDTGKTFVYYDSFWIEVGASPPASPFITDLDEDTKIQVEESSDEDKIRFDTAGSERMIIDSSGKVGIGTTSPEQRLHVNSGNTNISALFESTDANVRIYMQDSGSTDAQQVGLLGISDDLRLVAGGSARLAITSGGDVGIGTNSPDTDFHIQTASNTMAHFESTDGEALIAFSDNSSTGNWYDRRIGVIGDDMVFVTGNATRMTISDLGRFGIGNTNPDAQNGTEYQLDVKTSSGGCINMDHATATTTAGLMKGYSNVGGTNTLQFIVRADGDFESRTNSYGATSDETIKQDIVDAPSQWDDIKAVQLRKYRLIDDVTENGDNAVTQLGVIAQELEASGMGGLVVDADPDNDKQYKTVKYSVLLLKALGALQEAMARIEALEAE